MHVNMLIVVSYDCGLCLDHTSIANDGMSQCDGDVVFVTCVGVAAVLCHIVEYVGG